MSSEVSDPTLVSIRRDSGGWGFLASLAIICLLLTGAWIRGMGKFLQWKEPYCFTTAEKNLSDFAASTRNPRPDLIIVGTSLSKRLVPHYFEGLNVMNLSVAGGSAMTGLELVCATGLAPEHLLLEINVLDRPVDVELRDIGIWAFRSPETAVLAGASKPLRYLLSPPFFSTVPPARQRAVWQRTRERWIDAPPANYSIDALVARGVEAWNQRDDWDIAEANLRRIEELRPVLEKRGSRLHYLYLPYAPGYDEHAFASRMRSLAGGGSFEGPDCLDVRAITKVSDLRWVDGTHLDNRSAVLVCRAISGTLSGGR